MRILILGGDGYLGWPTAMHLSAKGNDVVVVDNYLRRRLCREVKVGPLVEVPELDKRCAIWEDLTGIKIPFFIGDLTGWEFIEKIFSAFIPEAIVHYAEQPAAPYSMLSRKAATLTLRNNLLVTANVIFAVREFCPPQKANCVFSISSPRPSASMSWLRKLRRQERSWD